MNADAAQAAIEAGGELVQAPLVLPSTGPALAQRALVVAQELLARGVAETAGRNRGPMVDQILVGYFHDRMSLLCLARYAGKPCPHCDGKPAATAACFGAPWCARTARYTYERAAAELGLPRPFAGWPNDLASASKWVEAGRQLGKLVTAPVPGDVGCILRDGGHGHVVLVAAVEGADVLTLEGNSGDRFASRRRPIASFAKFVRVA